MNQVIKLVLEIIIVIFLVWIMIKLMGPAEYQSRPIGAAGRELNMSSINDRPLSFAMLGRSSAYSSDTAIEIDHDALVPRKEGRTSAGELALRRAVAALFPTEQIMYNVRPKEITNDATGRPLEYDVYLPRLKIAFEYNGQQHYQYASDQHRRDVQKADKSARAGVRLIEIPYKYHTDDQIKRYIQSEIYG